MQTLRVCLPLAGCLACVVLMASDDLLPDSVGVLTAASATAMAAVAGCLLVHYRRLRREPEVLLERIRRARRQSVYEPGSL
jgi:hypothetical protein